MGDMQLWQDGRWTVIPEPFPDWEENEDWDSRVRRAGYEDFTSLGDPDGYEIQCYQREADPKYLIQFSDGNRWEYVGALTFGDAMDVIARWSPIVSAGVVSSALNSAWSLDAGGIVTQIMAAAQANAPYASALAREEEDVRSRRRREVRERRERAANSA